MTIKETNLKFTNTPSKRYSTKRIVLHHADASICDAATIHRWHQANGWSGMGYHFLVRKNGTIERGRPEDTIGAHCLSHNSDSIGICFEGNFSKEIMSETQLKSGQELLNYLYKKYNLTKNNVYRHKDLMATDCPGKNFPFDKVVDGTVENDSTPKEKTIKKKYSGTFPKLPSRGYFEFGDKGTQVKNLQKFLNWYNNYSLSLDGDFGNKTLSAIKDYQKKEKLNVDGLFGTECLKRAKKVKR